jgi:hypothetical protein
MSVLPEDQPRVYANADDGRVGDPSVYRGAKILDPPRQDGESRVVVIQESGPPDGKPVSITPERALSAQELLNKELPPQNTPVSVEVQKFLHDHTRPGAPLRKLLDFELKQSGFIDEGGNVDDLARSLLTEDLGVLVRIAKPRFKNAASEVVNDATLSPSKRKAYTRLVELIDLIERTSGYSVVEDRDRHFLDEMRSRLAGSSKVARAPHPGAGGQVSGGGASSGSSIRAVPPEIAKQFREGLEKIPNLRFY